MDLLWRSKCMLLSSGHDSAISLPSYQGSRKEIPEFLFSWLAGNRPFSGLSYRMTNYRTSACPCKEGSLKSRTVGYLRSREDFQEQRNPVSELPNLNDVFCVYKFWTEHQSLDRIFVSREGVAADNKAARQSAPTDQSASRFFSQIFFSFSVMLFFAFGDEAGNKSSSHLDLRLVRCAFYPGLCRLS